MSTFPFQHTASMAKDMLCAIKSYCDNKKQWHLIIHVQKNKENWFCNKFCDCSVMQDYLRALCMSIFLECCAWQILGFMVLALG